MTSAGLQHLPVDHIGIAVHDVDEAMRRYGQLFGIVEWRRIQFSAFADRHGSVLPITGTAATSSLGNIRIEVVSSGEGRWTVNDVLESRGESVFHVGYRVDDVGAVLSDLIAEGSNSNMKGVDLKGTPLFAYLEPAEPGALMIELVSSNMPASFFLKAPGLSG